jgi:hypothetical protein
MHQPVTGLDEGRGEKQKVPDIIYGEPRTARTHGPRLKRANLDDCPRE